MCVRQKSSAGMSRAYVRQAEKRCREAQGKYRQALKSIPGCVEQMIARQ